MKIQFRNLCLLGFLFLNGTLSLATTWEVGVMFLGGREPEEFQKDIDQNIIELAKLTPNIHFKLQILREFSDRIVTYSPDPSSKELHSWDTLFWKTPLAGVQIPGEMNVLLSDQSTKSLLANQQALIDSFLDRTFSEGGTENVRMLMIYGHGMGYKGLRALELPKLRKLLEGSITPRGSKPSLDVLWLNSCFMANLEAAYELRAVTRYLASSEEAEFSAGSPFDSMVTLQNGPDDVEATLKSLVTDYIDSYSYSVEGSQRRFVYSSAATLSLVDTQKVQPLAELSGLLVGALGGSLTSEQREYLSNNLPKSSMQDAEMVDYARLLIRIRDKKEVFTEGARTLAKKGLSLLEAGSDARLRTATRVTMRPPEPDQWVVYGYNGFTRGYEGDEEVLNKLPENLKPVTFFSGPNRKKWPARKVNKRLSVAPFTVGYDRFSYYFLKSPEDTLEIRGKATDVTRAYDAFVFEAKNEENPVRMSAYTQGIGKQAESYYGLSVLSPLLGIPNGRYLDLKFFETTSWGKFD